MSDAPGHLVEITELDHLSFSGDCSFASEMFSTSAENFNVSHSGSDKMKVMNLFTGEDSGDVPLPSLESLCDNTTLFVGFGLNSPTSPLSRSRSIRKSQRINRKNTPEKTETGIPEEPQAHSTPKKSPATFKAEKVNSMDESELREYLQESLFENSSLLEEVKIKDKAIRRLTECLNDIQVFQKSRRHTTGNASHNQNREQSFLEEFAMIDKDSELKENITGSVNEMNLLMGNLDLTNQISLYNPDIVEEMKAQDSKTSLFEEFSMAIRESRPALEQNVITGTYIAKDALLGGSVGWLGSYLLKKFGTTALTAATGGLLVIHLAARRGYVVVNWGEIYKEIEKQSEENQEVKSEMEWVGDKINDLKSWVHEHRYITAGFTLSFIYNMFK